MNESTIQELIALKQSLLDKIAHIDGVLSLYDGLLFPSTNTTGKVEIFNQKDSYKEKIAKVLKHENRFLNITQLINIIHSYKPTQNRDEVKDSVNSAKSLLLKDHAIAKITIGVSNQNSFYGSPSWLESENTPKKEHMYDESLIKEKKKIEI